MIGGTTHVSGHTLDLIFKQDIDINIMENRPLPWTDHHAINFKIINNTVIKKNDKPINITLDEIPEETPLRALQNHITESGGIDG